MVHTVTPAELASLASLPNVDLIDVRNQDEWDTGHLVGSRLVPLPQLIADPEKFLARGTTLVFICAKGVRSMQAAKLAERFGYENVYNLDGGTKEWARAGYDLSTERVAA